MVLIVAFVDVGFGFFLFSSLRSCLRRQFQLFFLGVELCEVQVGFKFRSQFVLEIYFLFYVITGVRIFCSYIVLFLFYIQFVFQSFEGLVLLVDRLYQGVDFISWGDFVVEGFGFLFCVCCFGRNLVLIELRFINGELISIFDSQVYKYVKSILIVFSRIGKELIFIDVIDIVLIGVVVGGLGERRIFRRQVGARFYLDVVVFCDKWMF